MKMKLALNVTLVTIFLFSVFAMAQNENKGWVDRNDPPSKKALESFRGLYFGITTFEQTQEFYPETLMCNEFIPTKAMCNGSHTIGDIYVENIMVFEEKILKEVIVMFDPDNYGGLKQIFISKYGPPSSIKKSVVQNMMGVSLPQEVSTWESATMHLSLSRYGSKITEGLATYMTQAELKKMMEEEAKAKKTGKNDF